jgi:hypothetical protein
MEGVDSVEGGRVTGGNIERIGRNECLTPLEIAEPAEWHLDFGQNTDGCSHVGTNSPNTDAGVY